MSDLDVAHFLDRHPAPWKTSQANLRSARVTDCRGFPILTMATAAGSDCEIATGLLLEAFNRSGSGDAAAWFFGVMQDLWSFAHWVAEKEPGDAELNDLIARVMGNRTTIEADDRKAIVTAVVRECAGMLGITPTPAE